MENELDKETAVEWYEKEINLLIEKYQSNEISEREFITMKHNLFYQAQQIEKKQIINAYNYGQQIPPFIYAEQYYAKTYGGKDGK
jgi:hypothetical protein